MAIHHQALELFPRTQARAHHLWRVTNALSALHVNTSLIRGSFTLFAGLCDLLAIGLSLAFIRLIHPQWADAGHMDQATMSLSSMVTIFFLASNWMRNEYEVMGYLVYKERIKSVFLPWNIVFLCALSIAFLTHMTIGLSLIRTLIFYSVGLLFLIILRMVLVSFVRKRAETGGIAARRVLLIGYEEDVASFSERYEPWRIGMRIAAASVLRGIDHLNEDLALASAYARILRPDDIFILVPWSQKETIDQCINAFMRIPASIHLGPEPVLDRFVNAQICKAGPIASLNLVHRPLSAAEVFVKRVFDITIASAALLILAPFFAAIAIAIKADSPGPVIFRQRRYGFNQQPFRIFKFRSMSTLEDDAALKQATENDARVTRIGKIMRRFNIDELPQLLNVVRGDMSLVGPRPHALAHDQQFERSIGLYARRHNVKPGITGWAQVNGFRGAITDEKIRHRIAHDLYYIDNWSLLFDMQILWLTVMSKKAYLNAY